MPKQIKFNLIIDKKPIRDIEDLVENFNIEDILEAYQNGSLKRWLSVRGLAEEVTKLDKIKGDTIETAHELCRILHAPCTKEQLEQGAYPFEFRQKFQAKLEQMASLKNQRDEIIREYHGGYDKLLSDMETQYDDYPFLKIAITQIYREYLGLFNLDIDRFYRRFIFDYPLVIFATLANLEMRDLLMKIINEQTLYEDLTNQEKLIASLSHRYKNNIAIPFSKRCETAEELTELQSKLKSVFVLQFSPDSQSFSSGGSALKFFETVKLKLPFIYVDNDISAFPPHVKSFSGKTDGYWKDVEPKGKWMIIRMESGNFVRNLGKNGEELKVHDVNGKFLILEGIDYKSNSDSDQLIYMEV